ncbi:fimbria/pilus outer membrane usher protein [Escherichia coli]|nr:fimbria/pilus outer membrane usher protein [Escherichia coli]
MLPPNLRGYAPDISGVAHTTAKVTVSQMGRVIYETQGSIPTRPIPPIPTPNHQPTTGRSPG